VKRLALVLAAILAIAFPAKVWAQVDAPSISASVDPKDIEVGEAFVVTFTITVDASGPSPTDPRLAVSDGIRASQPSVSTQTSISFMNGRMTRKSGITATWQAVATREGVFVLTPSASLNGKRVQANPALRIKVHAATPGGRRRPQPQQPNPFDPFGNPFGNPFSPFPKIPFDIPDPDPPQVPQADPELALDAPLDSRIFLRAVVDQKNPVVGEQVTLTVYLYTRALNLEASDPHEPSVPDFFVRDVLVQGTKPDARRVPINGVDWYVVTQWKKALFPLRAGDLDIGSMRMTFVEMRGRGGPGMTRESQPIKLHVTEPPLAGRPIGYQIGDVGSYTLSATVEPRTSEIGGAVAVNVTLNGVGNVPNAVRVPGSAAVEWLEPQLREDIELENGKVKGSRTFSYVVRPKKPGDVDLGEVTLPYWNPERKTYEVARAALGKVQVAPGKPSALAKDPGAPHDPWSSLPALRTDLASYPKARDPFTERPLYWAGLALGPVAVVAGSVGTRSLRRLRSWLTARRASHENGIDKALAQAREARKRDDRAALAAALERAMYLSIERATALKARALLLDQIPTALEERSVPRDLADEVRDLLSSIEATRFTPDAAPRAGDLADRVAGAVRRMNRLPAAARG
jgi:hypothetical protein